LEVGVGAGLQAQGHVAVQRLEGGAISWGHTHDLAHDKQGEGERDGGHEVALAGRH
jgi:hypothetical protein